MAVVTGASGGIGQAIAWELAQAGADVLVHGRKNRQRLDQTENGVRQRGRKSAAILADLSELDQHPRLVEWAWQRIGRVDIWINNAGADVLTGEAARWSFDRKLETLWAVDVRPTIRLSRLAGQRMQDVGGVILNIGWDQALWGMAGDSGQLFGATKGAVMAFTRSLAQSLAPQVRVNCLAPGWIKTAWGDQASPAWQQRAMTDSLLARWGRPEDVARMARCLCSDDAAFVTGQIICVDGGFRTSPLASPSEDVSPGKQPS